MKKKTKALVIAKKKEIAQSFEPEVVAIIKQSIAPNLTDAELKVYLGVCRQKHADPIMKDIIPVVFNTKYGRTLNFIISKNFCLKVAHQSKELDSLTSKLVRSEKGNIVGATATLWKKGSLHPFEVEVDFKEYYNEKNDLWKSHPGAMIQKVAKVLVLKEAFGIDMVSDIELSKGKMLQISDIEIPKSRFSISSEGRVRTIEQKGGEKETIKL